MLELRQVTKLYTGIPALEDVSFVAGKGEVTACLGPNGSGKSTMLKIIAGLVLPTQGEILFDGIPIRTDPIAYRQRFGCVPEDSQLYPHLTGEEYLDMVTQLRGLSNKKSQQKIEGFLRLFSLYEDRHLLISAYSKGMRQKILIAAALLHNPDLILLDEPFSGLDVNSALLLCCIIRELATRGKTLVLSSHELEVVEQVALRVVILHKGRIVANDALERLRTLMSLATLGDIFSELAVDQDIVSLANQVLQLIEA